MVASASFCGSPEAITGLSLSLFCLWFACGCTAEQMLCFFLNYTQSITCISSTLRPLHLKVDQPLLENSGLSRDGHHSLYPLRFFLSCFQAHRFPCRGIERGNMWTTNSTWSNILLLFPSLHMDQYVCGKNPRHLKFLFGMPLWFSPLEEFPVSTFPCPCV